MEPQRIHPGVIDDQHIALAQQLRYLRKPMLGRRTSGPTGERQQPRFIAPCGRLLGDQVGGKVVVEELDAHAWQAVVEVGSVWRVGLAGEGKAGPSPPYQSSGCGPPEDWSPGFGMPKCS